MLVLQFLIAVPACMRCTRTIRMKMVFSTLPTVERTPLDPNPELHQQD